MTGPIEIESKVLVAPIKAQGKKTKLIPWIRSVLPVKCATFIEPFMGTGEVSFNTFYDKYILNDINPYIVQFYEAVKTKDITPEKVREFLELEGKNLLAGGDDHFKRIRSRFNETHQPLDFLFLSRCCFNGLIRFNSKGGYNSPFCRKPDRFSKTLVTKITNQVESVAKKITPAWTLYNKDFREIIAMAAAEDVIYLDPPYYGLNTTYFQGWSDQDEADLYRLLKETPAKWVMSTWHHNTRRENPSIKTYWSEFNIQTKTHFYFVGSKAEYRNSVEEALVTNYP